MFARLPLFFAALAACVCLFGIACTTTAPSALSRISAQEIRQGYLNGHVIVRLKKNVEISASIFEAGNARMLAKETEAFGPSFVVPVRGDVIEALGTLRAHRQVASAGPDFLVRLPDPDPAGPELKRLSAIAPPSSAGTEQDPLKSATGYGGNAASVVVGIIDTSVRLSHCDLSGNWWKNKGESAPCCANDGVDNDRDGIIDDVFGIDATPLPKRPVLGQPDNGENRYHGTSVAGIIGANGGSGSGFLGVARSVQIMPLRAFGEVVEFGGERVTSASMVSIVYCIDYAVAHGAKIINASYGHRFFSHEEYRAIASARAAGVVVVAATGNGERKKGEEDSNLEYPASYLLDNVVAVTGANSENVLLGHLGADRVDLAALSQNIVSCGPKDDAEILSGNGTSFAAPQVTGALALLTEEYPNDTYRQRINRLLRGTRKADSHKQWLASGGVLDVPGALNSYGSNKPINDDLAGAIVLPSRCLITRGSNAFATEELWEQHADQPNLRATVWWAWKAPECGTYDVCTDESSADAIAVVYSMDASGKLMRVQPVMSDPSRRAASYQLAASVEYRIAVGSIAATGGIVLSIGQHPINDRFADATCLPLNTAVSGSNQFATKDGIEPKPEEPHAKRSVWYWCKLPNQGSYLATISSDAFAATAVVCRENKSDGTLAAVVSATCAANSPAIVAFTANANEVLYVMVDSSDEGFGRFDLQVSGPQ